MKSILLSVLTPLVFSTPLMAKPDYEVTIGTRHGQLRFLPELFAVKPGSQVKLTLENSDEMIHNLIVAKGGAKEVNRLADMALKLGEKGMEMGFVPDDPAVLASIGLAQPGESLSTEFRAPPDLGDYPFVCTFPGHSLTMRGVMKVVEDPSAVSVSEEDFVAEGTTPKNGVLEVGSEPRVVRVHVAGVDSGRSIAVGLPGGFNYLFDAEKLMVRMGWTGGFLNVSRDRRSRGGGPCSILGEKFEVGSDAFPLRIGNAQRIPEVRFRGYSRMGNPAFSYEVDGVEVRQTATGSAEGQGLTYGFEVRDAPKEVYFLVKPEGLEVTSTAGSWEPKGGYVRIPVRESKEFFVSVARK